MSKSYYKLKDQGTSFYDMAQQAGVVRDRIELLENTARVTQAVQDGQLIKLDADEGKAAYKKQEAAANGENAKTKSTDTEETEETDNSPDTEETEETAANKKNTGTKKNTGNK